MAGTAGEERSLEEGEPTGKALAAVANSNTSRLGGSTDRMRSDTILVPRRSVRRVNGREGMGGRAGAGEDEGAAGAGEADDGSSTRTKCSSDQSGHKDISSTSNVRGKVEAQDPLMNVAWGRMRRCRPAPSSPTARPATCKPVGSSHTDSDARMSPRRGADTMLAQPMETGTPGVEPNAKISRTARSMICRSF